MGNNEVHRILHQEFIEIVNDLNMAECRMLHAKGLRDKLNHLKYAHMLKTMTILKDDVLALIDWINAGMPSLDRSMTLEDVCAMGFSREATCEAYYDGSTIGYPDRGWYGVHLFGFDKEGKQVTFNTTYINGDIIQFSIQGEDIPKRVRRLEEE